MAATLTITAKGQITLRKEILTHLGAKPGDRLVVDLLHGGCLRIQPKRGQPAASIVGLLPDQCRSASRSTKSMKRRQPRGPGSVEDHGCTNARTSSCARSCRDDPHQAASANTP